MDVKPFPLSNNESLDCEFIRTKAESYDKSNGVSRLSTKNKHADNKLSPEDGDLFERDESASIF